jgi:hypothetical protein
MNKESKYGIEELIGCVRREIEERRRVYRRLVAELKMDAETAQREIGMMEAVRDKLEELEHPRLF